MKWYDIGNGYLWRSDGALLQPVGCSPAHSILYVPGKDPVRLRDVDSLYAPEEAMRIADQRYPPGKQGPKSFDELVELVGEEPTAAFASAGLEL